jgi:FKBP-type peptidyl-prolyl cis-trans isomerase (trigger factor)
VKTELRPPITVPDYASLSLPPADETVPEGAVEEVYQSLLQVASGNDQSKDGKKNWEAFGVKDEADLRQIIRKKLEAQKIAEDRPKRRTRILEFLAGGADFSVPESCLDAELERIFRALIEDNVRRGMTQKMMEGQLEKWKETLPEVARQNVKLELILEVIAEKEGIGLEKNDLELVLSIEANRQRRPAQAIVREFRENPFFRCTFRRKALAMKALDFILENASPVEGAKEEDRCGSCPCGCSCRGGECHGREILRESAPSGLAAVPAENSMRREEV